MRHIRLLLTLPLLGLCAVMNSPAQAQPDPNTAPKAQNPPNWGAREAFAVARPLTEEQQRQLRAQQAEIRAINLKSQLTRAGFTDEALQNAVVDEYKAQDAAKADLLAKWRKITAAIRANNTPETNMAALLKEFRDSSDKEQTRHQAASKALEDRFQISKKPLLDATLMTMGLTGNEATTIGQANTSTFQISNLFGAPAMDALGGAPGNLQPLFERRANAFAGGGLNNGVARGLFGGAQGAFGDAQGLGRFGAGNGAFGGKITPARPAPAAVGA